MRRLSIYHPVSLAYKELLPTATKTGVAGSEETLINYCKYLTEYNVVPHIYTQYYGSPLKWDHGYWKKKELFFQENHDCILSWSDDIEILKELRRHVGDNTIIITRFVNQKDEKDFRTMYNLVDYILTQSEWLSKRYRFLSPSKFVYVTNGLKDEPIYQREFGNEDIIYASDYERGLIHLLDFWPQIQNIYPNYKLHVCYGWEIFDRKYSKNGNNAIASSFKMKVEKLMQQRNITHYGRLGHDQLFDLLHRCDYWLYPCNFPENCSTLSLKMQAYGVYPIIISSGGLDETVNFGSKTNAVLWSSNRQPNAVEYNKALLEWQRDVLATFAHPPSRYAREYMMQKTYDKYKYTKCVSILANLVKTCVA